MGLVDFDTVLFNPIYTVFGDVAVLTLDDTAGTVIDTGANGEPLLAIDKTAGVVASLNGNDAGRNRFGAEVETVALAAVVQAPDLASIDLADLRDATLLLNSKTWTVRGHLLQQSCNGPGTGEVMLLLTEMA